MSPEMVMGAIRLPFGGEKRVAVCRTSLAQPARFSAMVISVAHKARCLVFMVRVPPCSPQAELLLLALFQFCHDSSCAGDVKLGRGCVTGSARNRVAQHANLFDLAFHHVAGLEELRRGAGEADAARRAGGD